MSDGSVGILALVAIIWIGWPLMRIAEHLRALRALAEDRRV